MIKSRIAVVACLMTFVLGCGRENSAPSSIVLTNTVEVVREVVVTNTVTVAVTNVVTVKRVEEMPLSARKTAPWIVTSSSLDIGRLRRLLSDSGVRVISGSNGSVALAEARDASIAALTVGGVVSAHALTIDEKIADNAGECVRIIPVSTIDCAKIAEAVRAAGGTIGQVVTVGGAVVRARLSPDAVRRLAARGDVLRIER